LRIRTLVDFGWHDGDVPTAMTPRWKGLNDDDDDDDDDDHHAHDDDAMLGRYYYFIFDWISAPVRTTSGPKCLWGKKIDSAIITYGKLKNLRLVYRFTDS